MLVCAPVTSRSGYGAHARDLVWSFLQHDKYDIKIIDVRWGECPRNALDKNNKKDKTILDCILSEPRMDKQPDIYVDIRIPNEFQQWGRFNIGITAGIETDVISKKWIDGCNKMDLIIVPSEHSKRGFVSTVYDKIETLPDGKKQKVGELKVEKSVEVLFEGADENLYKHINVKDIPSDFLKKINNIIKEKHAFLSVGQWTKGGYGEDRKDIGKLIKVFIESFANKKKKPALLLKTSGAGFSISDKSECIDKIRNVKNMFPSDWNLPNIYLLHGDLSDEEMNYLYNHPKIKSMVSFTHGEGFGRPLLEASMVGLYIITTGWSGHIDFLDNEKSILLNGELKKVPKSVRWKDIIVKESKWFIVDEQNAYKALNYVFENLYEVKNKAKSLMYKNRDKFTLNKMADKLDDIMEKYIGNIPSHVKLQLPKLKKIKNKKEITKTNFPKLKKVTEKV